MVNYVSDFTKLCLLKGPKSWGSMPPSLPRVLHTDMYLPPYTPILPSLAPKAERNPARPGGTWEQDQVDVTNDASWMLVAASYYTHSLINIFTTQHHPNFTPLCLFNTFPVTNCQHASFAKLGPLFILYCHWLVVTCYGITLNGVGDKHTRIGRCIHGT